MLALHAYVTQASFSRLGSTLVQCALAHYADLDGEIDVAALSDRQPELVVAMAAGPSGGARSWFGVFALGLGWVAPAFEVYTFSRTDLAGTVSLVVPVLLALAGGEVGRRAGGAASTAGRAPPAPSGGTPAA